MLTSNTSLGPYQILSLLGAGGMGEVYRARDTRLEREVAIKVLPTDFARDADRLRRFEQEARATSALNHPNILTVYDIGTHDGSPYIVAELLAGEELRAQLDHGALTLRQALGYAQQITQGLAAAHEKGIVHRDLKPENLFITHDGRVKILDFGLAKLKSPTGGADSDAPTLLPLTDPGAVMGTVGYMSPEQVRGQDADHRADIFAFGAILYEMLAGQRAFGGGSVGEMMSAILKEEPPDLSETNQQISPQLERIMRRCLEKRPERRFQSTSDLGFALEALSSPGSAGGSPAPGVSVMAAEAREPRALLGRWRERIAWIVAGVAVLTAFALGVAYFKRSATDTRAVRLSFVPPPNLSFNDAQADAVVVSPDGQKLAFTASAANGKRQLWVRPLDSLDAQPLPGTDEAIEPFWSPDSRSIAFGSQGKLKRVDLAGGSSQVLCDAARLTGGAWSNQGVIVFGPDFSSALFQIPATGGEPKPVTVKNTARGDNQHVSPAFLPGGKHFLFRINPNKGVWVGSLDSKEVKQVLTDNTNAAYAPPGWLLFVRNQALVAQAFDADRLQLKGEAMPIATQPTTRESAGYLFPVSDNGVLVWQGNWERESQLLWFDRAGKQVGAIGSPMKVSAGQEPRLSPDGKRLVMRRESNIWVIDLIRSNGIRLTSVFSQLPIWSPDGSHVAFNSSLKGSNLGIVQKAANGVGEAEMLLKYSNDPAFPADWSSDGRFILFYRRGEKTRIDIWVLPLFGDKQEYPLINSAFEERNARLSPDGRWLAYSSDESGSYEIYVQSFTADGKVGGDKKRISTNGGTQPTWRGQELFYVAEDGQMMSVAVKTSGAEFEYSTPKGLFKTRMLARSLLYPEYDVAADGQQFLVGTLIGESKAAPPTVILNWTAEMKR